MGLNRWIINGIRGGQKLENANSKNLEFTSIEASDAGSYRVSISNEAGVVQEFIVDLIVNEPIGIAEQLSEARVIEVGQCN